MIVLIVFADYFENQWLNSVWKNWAIYMATSGYSMSNSPIESYNLVITKCMTLRKKYHLIPILEIFLKKFLFTPVIAHNFRIV